MTTALGARSATATVVLARRLSTRRNRAKVTFIVAASDDKLTATAATRARALKKLADTHNSPATFGADLVRRLHAGSPLGGGLR